MAKRKGKGTLIAGAIMVLFLGAFAHYLLTFDYLDESGKSANKPRVERVPLRGALRIDAAQASERKFFAEFTLANDDTMRTRVLDTATPEPLYFLSMQYRATSGEAYVPVPRKDLRTAATDKIYDANRDAVVELLPGRALTRRFMISTVFDMQADGQYELTASYQPKKVADVMGGEFEKLDVYTGAVTQRIEFELPIKPAENKTPPPAQPAINRAN